jgi:UTP--glucose-1-phosphate uridylyltransferase
MSIKTVVFPVAGMGTRFLPATKSSPKEMLPVLNKPLIQYAVEEAILSGIENFIFIVSEGKEAIEKHFTNDKELLHHLVSKNKNDSIISVLESTLPMDKTTFVLQEKPLGLGHAISCAAPYLKDSEEPFAVILPDDLYISETPCLLQMINLFEKNKIKGHMMSMQKVPKEDVSKYGIASIKKGSSGKLLNIDQIIEKPKKTDFASNYGVVGRYILQTSIFDDIKNTKAGSGDEIQLTDAIIPMIKKGGVFGTVPKGYRYDCGSKIGWLQANIAMASMDMEIKPHLSKMFKEFS